MGHQPAAESTRVVRIPIAPPADRRAWERGRGSDPLVAAIAAVIRSAIEADDEATRRDTAGAGTEPGDEAGARGVG